MNKLAIIFLAALFLSACSKEEESASAPKLSDFEQERAALAAKIKSKARKSTQEIRKGKKGTGDGTEFAVVDKEYTYESAGKRDPFRSFVLQMAKRTEDARGPLEQFDLAQLSVVAVVWGTDRPRALVADPSGRGYIVSEGTYMGKNDGVVMSIADNSLMVKESYVDYFGETTTKDVQMRVRAEKGVE